MEFLQRDRRCRNDYVRALEEERKKIEVFQRELPLCLQLVTHAIDSVRQHLSDEEGVNNGGPILEEFIPLKPSLTPSLERCEAAAMEFDRKPDWLRSVQLWSQDPDTALRVEPPKKPIAVGLNKIGGAFQPFERKKHAAPPPTVPAAAVSSTTSGTGCGDGSGCSSSAGDKEKDKEKDKEGQSQSHRKTRRCWSPELHRRFLHALEQLGGSHVATPKQIRELMKVDGLTNDEVKSHLQKYRLHTRRPSPAAQSSSNSPVPPQILLVGGILVPPPMPEYVAAVGNGTASTPLNGMYSPMASHPSDLKYPKQQLQANEGLQRSSSTGYESSVDNEDDATNSACVSTSVTCQTTTASPSL